MPRLPRPPLPVWFAVVVGAAFASCAWRQRPRVLRRAPIVVTPARPVRIATPGLTGGNGVSELCTVLPPGVSLNYRRGGSVEDSAGVDVGLRATVVRRGRPPVEMAPANQEPVDLGRRFEVCFESSQVRDGDPIDGIEFAAVRSIALEEIRWRTERRIAMP